MAMPRNRRMTELLGGAGQEEVDLGGMAAEPTGTDALATGDLAAAVGEGADTLDADALEVEELEAALADPETPPEMRAQLQARLATAARRRLAGVGDAGGVM